MKYRLEKRHSGAITALVLLDRRLFSASSDHSVMEWSLDDQKWKKLITVHDDVVNALFIARGRLFSGSDDESMRVSEIVEEKQV